MSSRLSRKLMDHSERRLTALFLLTIVATLQVPISSSSFEPKNRKDNPTPFPCQYRPCGCRTAEQCRKKCCCFSAGQKLARAKRYGVKATDVVEVTTTLGPRLATPRKTCCSANRVASSNTGNPLLSAKTSSAARQKTTKIVLGIIAQECHGHAQTLLGQLVFLIPPEISLESFFESTGERFILSGLRFVESTAEPPVPPPRLFMA